MKIKVNKNVCVFQTFCLLIAAANGQELYKEGTKVVKRGGRELFSAAAFLCPNSASKNLRFCSGLGNNGFGGSQCDATGLVVSTLR